MPSLNASTMPLARGNPIALLGHAVLVILGYLGGMAVLAISSMRALAHPGKPPAPLLKALSGQWAWLFGAGLPLMAIMHIALGTFLAMQAFYGATFAQGAGPVVGVGLFRNLSPLMAGFVMAGLAAGRLVPELRRPTLKGLDDSSGWIPDREVVLGLVPDPRPEPEPARLVAVRLLAAAVAGPVFCVLGGTVGMVAGMFLSQAMLNLAPEQFLSKFSEMFWLRDVLGVPVKGATFALVATLFACHEGLRGGPGDGPDSTAWAAARSAILASVSILLLNSAWFLLVYYAGPAFGPTVLPSPHS